MVTLNGFHEFAGNHTLPRQKSNSPNASHAGATESPERGCVEDQPQHLSIIEARRC
jgi:hypothetical protein